MLSRSVVSDSFQHHWTVSQQASLSMEVPREEYWSGVLFPPPGDLPNPGIEPRSLALQADALPAELLGKPRMFGDVKWGYLAASLTSIY